VLLVHGRITTTSADSAENIWKNKALSNFVTVVSIPFISTHRIEPLALAQVGVMKNRPGIQPIIADRAVVLRLLKSAKTLYNTPITK